MTTEEKNNGTAVQNVVSEIYNIGEYLANDCFCFGCGKWFMSLPDVEYMRSCDWDTLCHVDCCPGNGPECRLCHVNGGE